MRKMIFNFQPNRLLMKLSGNFMDHIEHFEMLEMLRLDFEKGVKVLLGEITLKAGSEFDDIDWPRTVTHTIIKEDGNQYIVILTGRVPNRKFLEIFSKFQSDVIWTTPTYWTGRQLTISCIGEENELKKIIKTMKLLGTVGNVRFHRAVYQEHNILSVLTDKQREIVIAAKRRGYYEYPRRIDAGGLAESVGVTKATAIEHLRKAEGRLMANILAGY